MYALNDILFAEFCKQIRCLLFYIFLQKNNKSSYEEAHNDLRSSKQQGWMCTQLSVLMYRRMLYGLKL